jgi:hypothetical protein
MTDSDDLDTMEDDEDGQFGHPSSKSNLVFSFSTSVFKPFRIKMKYFFKCYLYQNFKHNEA